VVAVSLKKKTITQRAVATSMEDYEKREVLRELIRSAENLKNAIIFCNRKVEVSNLWKSLDRHGFSVGALHGDMDQRSRTAMLQGFKDNKIQLLVASDVAARGLDIPDVSHVFNFDVPVSAEDYVHRIGRTGRAGRSGATFMIVTPADRKGFEAIEELISEKIEWQGEPVEWDDRARRGRGGPKREDGRRDSARGRGGKSPRKPVEAAAAARTAPEGNEEHKPARAHAERPARKQQEAQPVDAAPAKRRPEQPAKAPPRQPVRHGGETRSPEHANSDHPFGGEENIPAFLRG
jgi:superfamily II DNA/RNA helicase